MTSILFKLMAAASNTPAPVDSTPDAFSFTDTSNVGLNATQTSNTITVAGMDAGAVAAVTVSGGTYSKNSGAYSSSNTTATLNDTFSVRHTSSSSNSTAVNTTLTIGGVSDVFTSTTQASASDVTPNALNWNNILTSASSANTNSQTITGINTSITLLVSFTEDRDNYTLQANVNGSFVGSPLNSPGSFTFSVSNNDVVYFRASGGETRDSVATVTNQSDGNAAIDTFGVELQD